jgi:hypothetical protein
VAAQRPIVCALFAATLGLAVVTRAFPATTADTPECHIALDDANRLMRAVQARQMQFSRFDPAENCRLLRDNLDDLTAARDPLDRCLSGDEHTRSLGQIDAAIEQVRAQLIGNCRR